MKKTTLTPAGERTGERGAAFVMVGIMLGVLVGIGALAFDLSAVYAKKSSMQRAADAGVLAGVIEYVSSRDDVTARNVVKDYFDLNMGDDLLNEETDISTILNGNQFKITLDKVLAQKYGLARILGLSEGNVRIRASAMVTPVSSVAPGGGGGVMPWGVYPIVLSAGYGSLVELKEGRPLDSGWFGCLALNGPGANEYRDGIENGCRIIVSVGDIVTPKSGNNSGPTSQGVGSRIAGHEACTYLNCETDCPRLVIVPVLNPAGNWEIVGFAQFFLEGVQASGISNIVTGRFVRASLDSDAAKGNGEVSDYGALVVNLVE